MKIIHNRERGCGYAGGGKVPEWVVWLLKMAVLAAIIALIWFINPKARAGEVTDLGVIGARSIINLEKCQRRTDFAAFKVEIIPRNLRGWTNKVEFQTTNTFLTLADLQAVPEGLAVMGIRQICADNSVSPVAIFKIDVQRSEPDAPRAYVSTILTNVTEQKMEHVLEAIQNVPTPAPPAPPGMTNPPASHVPTRTRTTTTTRPEASYYPLPGGTNETYSQYQARLERMIQAGIRLKNNR